VALLSPFLSAARLGLSLDLCLSLLQSLKARSFHDTIIIVSMPEWTSDSPPLSSQGPMRRAWQRRFLISDGDYASHKRKG
jgi:hypothetical protein